MKLNSFFMVLMYVSFDLSKQLRILPSSWMLFVTVKTAYAVVLTTAVKPVTGLEEESRQAKVVSIGHSLYVDVKLMA